MKSYFVLLKEKLCQIDMSKIFYNNKIVFILSVLASFGIWVSMNASGADSNPITVSDIPVTIGLSQSAIQDGLRIFSGQNIKSEVSISGNKLIVGQVTRDDILVTAQQAETISSPGKYTLELTAHKAGLLSDYEFASGVQPAFITIMVDRYREVEFNVEPEIEFTANPKYFLGATTLSSTKVVLSGPESEVSKIKRVVAKGEIDHELHSTFAGKVPLVMYDAYGEKIISETVSCTVDEVEVVIPVLMKKRLRVKPNFINEPQGSGVSCGGVKVTPDTLEIAGPEDQINAMNVIDLDNIDFRNVNVQRNKFSLPINLPSGCRSLNNIYSAEVDIDTSEFKEKSFWVTQISFKNIPEGKSAKAYTDGIDVKIVGPMGRLRTLSPSDIEVVIDLNGKNDLTGSMEASADIYVKNCDEVWAYGEYLINIEIT